MIKDFIKLDAEGIKAFFGIEEERGDVIYDKCIDVFNNAIDDASEFFNKNTAVSAMIAIAENEKEEAYLLYFAGQFIGELTAKIELGARML